MFYSQTPWGEPDRSSLHAGCPVLKGEKWAANLWVWNGARHGYWKENKSTGKSEKISLASSTVRMTAIFSSEITGGAMLYWEDKFWSDLLPGKEEVVESYVGHKWYQPIPILYQHTLASHLFITNPLIYDNNTPLNNTHSFS